MADRTEDKGTADSGAKNAEELDCLRRELETLIKLVQVLAKATKDLQETQEESRSYLTRRIDSNEARINRMDSRIDGVHGSVASKATELREDSARLIGQAQNRINEVQENLSEKLVYSDKRIDYLREDLSRKIVDANKRVDEVRNDRSKK